MFEMHKAEIEERIKGLLEEREQNIKDEQELRKALENIKKKEDQLKAEGVSEGKQSFTLQNNDLDYINKGFVKDANDWIRQHEETYHTGIFYQTKDYIEHKDLYLKPSYTVTIDWTSIGRLVAVVCNTCKKHNITTNSESEDYMFCDEA